MQLQSHGVLVGATQSGKSTLATKWMGAQKKAVKIFVNTKRQKEWRAYCKYKIETAEHMEYVYEHYNKFALSPHFLLIEPDVTDKSATDKIAQLFDVCLKYHQDNPNKYTTVIFIDEIQVFQSKFSRSESFARIWTMGMGLRLFGIACAQRPALINNDILYNSETWIIMHLTKADMEYLNDRGIIDYDAEKHVFTGKYDAYMQTNKIKGLVKLNQ